MKTFETPIIEVITFSAENIMTDSNDSTLPWDPYKW